MIIPKTPEYKKRCIICGRQFTRDDTKGNFGKATTCGRPECRGQKIIERFRQKYESWAADSNRY